jgi:hypothetical protein
MLVDLARVVNNAGNGIRSIGAKSTIRAARSSLTGNGTALAAISGGRLLTSGSNVVEANGVEGAFTGSFATK